MAFTSSEIEDLFQRDLDLLIQNIEAVSEEKLWRTESGISNSCGVLAQHLVGNLHHFIGHGLGNTGYKRQRELEFTTTGISKEELISEIRNLKESLTKVMAGLTEEQLKEDFPMSLPYGHSTGKFLIHLYGHLNYHLGQINYLRRMIDETP